MRQDRLTSLKEKLRQGSGNFEFGALLEGVSTIEEEPVAEVVELLTSEATVLHEPTIEEVLPGALQLEIPVVGPVRDHLRTALESLCSQLGRELGGLRASLASHSLEESGRRLAQAFRMLDLIQTLDPDGDAARSLGIHGAPPSGSWPRPAWSLAEFAESPISGLLPSNSDDQFVRGLLYEAWGVRFETPLPPHI